MSRQLTEHRPVSPIGSEAPQASEREIEYVYDTLRAIARRERGRNPSLTLNTTALVHEAWLKLGKDQKFDGERHCLGSYAMAIRQVLVDYIRAQTAAKRTPDDDYQRVVSGHSRPFFRKPIWLGNLLPNSTRSRSCPERPVPVAPLASGKS
jgi:hypothetical protein